MREPTVGRKWTDGRTRRRAGCGCNSAPSPQPRDSEIDLILSSISATREALGSNSCLDLLRVHPVALGFVHPLPGACGYARSVQAVCCWQDEIRYGRSTVNKHPNATCNKDEMASCSPLLVCGPQSAWKDSPYIIPHTPYPRTAQYQPVGDRVSVGKSRLSSAIGGDTTVINRSKCHVAMLWCLVPWNSTMGESSQSIIDAIMIPQTPIDHRKHTHTRQSNEPPDPKNGRFCEELFDVCGYVTTDVG
ncbi:hypothetical protein QBC39DRAFT_70751 [Podospora conica]|nr:hypothetical protein QBC39DRAFT_70751 [Schizothecium conicum]